MKTLVNINIIIAGLVFSSFAHAHLGDFHKHDNGFRHPVYSKHIDRVQEKQHRKIEKGYAKGQLTRGETKRLEREQRKIAAMERHFKGDGYLSGVERRILWERMERANDRINDYKHNDRTRFHKGHHYGYGAPHAKFGGHPYGVQNDVRRNHRDNSYRAGLYINW